MPSGSWTWELVDVVIALGVTGGIGAYKAVEVCRGLQKRGHDVVAVMTRSATRFVGPVTFEAITRRPVITSQWRAGHERRHRAHRHRRSASTCCWSPRARPTSSASSPTASPTTSSRRCTWPRSAPVLLAPAMNTQHAGARRRAAEPADPGRPRRAVRRAWRGLSGVRLDRQGPAGGAGGHRRWRPCALLLAADSRRFAACASSSPPVRPTRTSIPFATSGIAPADGWASRSPRKPAAAARMSRWSPAPRRSSRLPVDELVRVRSAAEMHAAVMRGRVLMPMWSSWPPPSPTTRRRPPRREACQNRRTDDADAQPHPGHPGRSGCRRTAAARPARCSSGSQPKPTTCCEGARETRTQGRRSDCRQRRSRPDRGFDVETNAVTIIGDDGERDDPAAEQGSASPPRSSIAWSPCCEPRDCRRRLHQLNTVNDDAARRIWSSSASLAWRGAAGAGVAQSQRALERSPTFVQLTLPGPGRRAGEPLTADRSAARPGLDAAQPIRCSRLRQKCWPRCVPRLAGLHRCKLHALGRSRSSSASATRMPT